MCRNAERVPKLDAFHNFAGAFHLAKVHHSAGLSGPPAAGKWKWTARILEEEAEAVWVWEFLFFVPFSICK